MSEAQPLAGSCTENFAVKYDHVYFQAGDTGQLCRVPCQGGGLQTLHDTSGYLVVEGGWVYFQAGDKGLYRVQFDGRESAQPLHDKPIGHLAVPGDGYVYFHDEGNGVCRKLCTGGETNTLAAEGFSPGFVVVHDDYVYFQGTGGDLRRVPCAGGTGGKSQQLYGSSGYMVVDGGWVYFQAGKDGPLCRVPCAGGEMQQLYKSGGYLAVRNNWIYFQGDGLRRVLCTGGDSQPLDDNGGHLVVPGDGYVYFQSQGHGLYRVPCDASAKAEQLDDRCGNLAIPDPFDGFIYFQGGSGNEGLYRRLMPANCAPAPGLRVNVQDQYVVSTLTRSDIDAKLKAITDLLNGASRDASDTWFINFTSGASILAYPSAVAGQINGLARPAIKYFETHRANRLGTIVMDFPDDDGKTDYIDDVFNLNSTARLSAADWMGDLKRGNPNAKTLKLSRLTIPGTHDSCTFNASAISKCQNLTLPQQLQAGIRFIDIRCRHYRDKFELHHGIEYLHMNFDYVLQTCRDFLRQHREECIVMSVKREHESDENKKTFQEVFTDYVQAYSSDLAWYLGNTMPELDNVKGKVILMRRFYVGVGSDCTRWSLDLSDWPEDTTFVWP